MRVRQDRGQDSRGEGHTGSRQGSLGKTQSGLKSEYNTRGEGHNKANAVTEVKSRTQFVWKPYFLAKFSSAFIG